MITTPDGISLYSEEEYQSVATQQFNVGVEYATNGVTNRLRNSAIEWFKSEVRSGSMIKEDAEGIFNGLAEALGWDTVTSLSTLYVVTVDYNGNTIAEFSGVEADDEDDAVNKVEGDLEVDDVEISFILSYNGDSCRESVNMTYEFDSSELEFSAVEQ